MSRHLRLADTPEPADFVSWLEQRSLPDSVLDKPQQWLVDSLSLGRRVHSGVTVNETTALSVSAVLSAVRVRGEAIGMLPLPVYERLQPRGKQKAYDHPVYELLSLRANPWLSQMRFRELMSAWRDLRGNAYAEIEWGEDGYPKALWPLAPWRVKPRRRDRAFGSVENRAAGDLVYEVTLPDNGGKVTLESWQVLHWAGLSLNGVEGLSVIGAVREALGLGIALEQFAAEFFGQGTQFGGFIERPREAGKLSDEAWERLRKELNDARGLENAHRLKILEEGMSYKAATLPLNDLQFLEARKFQVSEIARIFRVPPHMIGDLDRATFSNIEHQSLEFVIWMLQPELVRLEQELNWQLFLPEERKRFFAQFIMDGAVRGDFKSRMDGYRIAIEMGIFSPNDVRELENHNPYEGGDTYLVPANEQPIGEMEIGTRARRLAEGVRTGAVMRNEYREGVGLPPDPAGDVYLQYFAQQTVQEGTQLSLEFQADQSQGGDGGEALRRLPSPEPRSVARLRQKRSLDNRRRLSDRYRPLIEDAADRVVRREVKDVRQAAKKRLGERSVDSFREWLNEYYADAAEWMQRTYEPVLQTYGALVADEAADEVAGSHDNDETREHVTDYTASASTRHAAKSRQQLEALLDEAPDDPLAAIEKRLDEWEETRAERIGWREVIELAGAVSVFVYKRNGVTKKVWSGGDCPFCRRLNGTVVGIDESFVDDGDELESDDDTPAMAVSGTKRHPPLHLKCDCQISAVAE